jgi:FkbM family methyltransferase
MYKLLHKLPIFKGKLRLSKFLYSKFIKLNSPTTFSLSNGLIFSVPNLIENVSFELYINGIYEKKYLRIINQSIPPNGIFIDVGANVGAISVLLAKQRPDITIYAFEASQRVFHYLEMNKIQNSLSNLNTYNIAVHKESNLELPFFSPEEKNGKGSFSPVFTEIPETVKTISLDVFFEKEKIKPDFIKVDVEGYEALIFESMQKHLRSSNGCPILFEFIDWAEKLANFEIGYAQQILINSKYNLYHIDLNKMILEPLTIGNAMLLAKKSKL